MTEQEKQAQIALMQKNEEEKFITHFATPKQITKFKFTDQECPFDFGIISGHTFFIGENKTRPDYDSEFFLKRGPFLELLKIEGMQRSRDGFIAKNNKYAEMLYLNFCSDALQIYQLRDKDSYTFRWRRLPKDQIDKTLVWKKVAELYNPIEIIYYSNK